MEKQGVFYAVSVGPGDPELMTRQACRVLEACGVIAAPRMKSGRMLALDIAGGAVDMQGKTILPLDFTMAHDAAVREESYRTASGAIEAELTAGRDVAMVNLGDVSVYATAYYILERVRSDGFETVMCPGVTSFCAVAARLGRSLTRMEEPLHILPGSMDMDSALTLEGTKVLMKSGRMLALDIAAGAVDMQGKAILPLDFTMARDAAVREDSYRTAAAAIEAALAAGRDVAMVNLGDVSVYATAYYILERIRADGFETVMCPGVTSFCAVAARLGRSLTRMDEPLHILPGSTDLNNALALPGTKVVMKSGKAIHETAEALKRHGLLANAGMVADCGLETEQVYTDLQQLPEEISYFATIVAD